MRQKEAKVVTRVAKNAKVMAIVIIAATFYFFCKMDRKIRDCI